MTDKSALEAAAAAGVISTDQAAALDTFLTSHTPAVTVAVPGEEDLRFIRNFHDVFLAIGIALFAIGMAIGIATAVAGAKDPLTGVTETGIYCAAAAAIMWVLGEFFARRRRLFLPAIAIVCALTVFAVLAALSIYFGLLLHTSAEHIDLSNMPPQFKVGILVGVAFAVIAPAAFYLRFRLPFSLGMTGAGFAFFVVVSALMANFNLTIQALPLLYLVLGILLFLAGVAFDARDPERATRLSDNGFWLHFAAAPLILNGAFGLIGMMFAKSSAGVAAGIGGLAMARAWGSPEAVGQAGLTLLVIVVLGLISLLINRRALIVSALLTAGIAIAILMQATGLGSGALAASTLITLGAFVLIVGASWHAARRALLSWVSPGGAWARIFPPEVAST